MSQDITENQLQTDLRKLKSEMRYLNTCDRFQTTIDDIDRMDEINEEMNWIQSLLDNGETDYPDNDYDRDDFPLSLEYDEMGAEDFDWD